ncbi:Hypothetical predicted protein [Mytilus galloprovincialis]|uniref:Uncharacterized protein n=1 Tax=Mytilus galloprovincialis TaxID=29158 RepID=A0A8B6DW71_MYTGA|nr:Hypothetical predicted protein [Mytilus galloprovincialis]
MLLNFDEIPVKKIEIPEGIFIINKQNILFGIALQYQELTGFLSLQEAIQNCIKQSNKFLIMIGAICSAVYYYNHTYYFFDTHSHSECTLNNPLDSSGKSILIGFADYHDLLSYLYAFYTSLQIDLDSQFEILPVSISSKDTDKDVTNQIRNYFDEEKLRNTKQNKKAYQADRKKLQREERQREQRELASKREARKNEDFKKTELAAKREARKNEDFKKTELAAKREARKNEDFNKRDFADIREARKNEDFKKRELSDI